MNAFRNLNRPVAQAFDKEIIKVEKFVITGGKPLHGEVIPELTREIATILKLEGYEETAE